MLGYLNFTIKYNLYLRPLFLIIASLTLICEDVLQQVFYCLSARGVNMMAALSIFLCIAKADIFLHTNEIIIST